MREKSEGGVREKSEGGVIHNYLTSFYHHRLAPCPVGVPYQRVKPQLVFVCSDSSERRGKKRSLQRPAKKTDARMTDALDVFMRPERAKPVRSAPLPKRSRAKPEQNQVLDLSALRKHFVEGNVPNQSFGASSCGACLRSHGRAFDTRAIAPTSTPTPHPSTPRPPPHATCYC